MLQPSHITLTDDLTFIPLVNVRTGDAVGTHSVAMRWGGVMVATRNRVRSGRLEVSKARNMLDSEEGRKCRMVTCTFKDASSNPRLATELQLLSNGTCGRALSYPHVQDSLLCLVCRRSHRFRSRDTGDAGQSCIHVCRHSLIFVQYLQTTLGYEQPYFIL